MSIRQYRPRSNRRHGISANQNLGLYLLLAFAIAIQISYPLVSGDALRYVTIFTVITGALLMLAHSLLSYGFRYFATFASVPFAWIMMAHPVLIAARKTVPGWAFIYGGAGLMVWDLFLDPQMVAANRWTWDVVGPHVPFQPEIPLSNTAGWLFAGMGLIALLHVILPKERRKAGVNSTIPDIFLGWTLFSGVVGNLFFFDRSGIALLGGVAFTLWIAPYLFVISFGKPDLLK